jgi:hypothetical protein
MSPAGGAGLTPKDGVSTIETRQSMDDELAWQDRVKALLGGRLGIVLSCGVTTFVSHGFFWSTVKFMNSWTKGWYAARHPVMAVDRCVVEVSTATCDRLVEFLTVTDSRAALNYEIARMLQAWEFGFLGTAYWAGTLMALMLFAALKQGYDDLGSWGKGVLLGLTCATAFFGGLPQLVSLDQNIQENVDAYNAYDGISAEIRTYMKSGQAITGNHVDGASFLHKVDTMIASIPATQLHFDSDKIDLGQSRFMELSQQVEGSAAP